MTRRPPPAAWPTRRAFLTTAAACVAACTTDDPAQPEPALDAAAAPDLAALDAAVAPDLAAPDLASPPPADPLLTPASASFPLGVASGDPTADGALLWTRYDGVLPMALAVYEVRDGAYVREVAQQVQPADGGFVHALVTNLAPGGEYAYAFFEQSGDQRTGRSPLGRFRTAPAADALAPISFGATCCTKAGLPLSTIDHAGGRTDLSFFCLLGDIVYADGATNVAQFRQKWAENMSTGAYRKLRASTSVIATWDDHDTFNDWDPETIDPALGNAARQALFDSLPIRRDAGAPQRLYRSFSHGRALEIFVLDCRSERRPSTRKTAAAQYLSAAQMAWLKDGLSRSTAVFKVILNSAPITIFPDEADPALTWGGYAAQRTEILSFIEQRALRGVLWISGDYHFPCIGRASRTGVGSTALEVLTGCANQTPSGRGSICKAPQFDWAGSTNNYLAVHLDPGTSAARLVFHDGTGAVLTDRTYVLT